MEQKLLRIYRDDTSELDKYLANGWAISQISATGYMGSSVGYTYCYVVITKHKINETE